MGRAAYVPGSAGSSVLGSLSAPIRWILVLSHSADGDIEASRGDVVYPKSLSWEVAELGLECRSVQLQSLCL